jgi:uncharacterized repeat protein (TIGR02543 family)
MKRLVKGILAAMMMLAIVPSTAMPVFAETSTTTTAAAMPANAFEASADNGVKVKASFAEGVFPAGTTMKVTAVADTEAKNAAVAALPSDEVVVDAQAVDITFYNAEGKEVEPADSNSVHVELSSAREVNGSSHEVLHLNDNGKTEKVADATATSAAFEGTSFSVYAIVGTATATRTYNFYLNKTATDVYYSQILKNGESISLPATPAAAANNQFIGWSATGSANDLYAFNKVEGLTADETVNLYAVYQTSYHVFYHNADGTILEEDTVQNGTYTVSAALVSSVSITGDVACVGFASTQNAVKAETEVTVNNANIDLYPVILASNWITFKMNDDNDTSKAAYTAPEYVLPGNTAVKPVDPTRQGYSFAGWYTDAALSNEYTFDGKLDADVTLYAKWTAGTASYTVLYWQQELVDGKYVEGNYHYPYYEKETLQGTSGTTISVDDAATEAASTKQKNYEFFHFGHADTNVVLNGDGSAILNVYYDLNTYTFNFIYYAGATLHKDGKNYASVTKPYNFTAADPELYSFTARLGEYVYDKWPLNSDFTNVKAGNVLLGWMPINLYTYFQVPRTNITKDLFINDAQKQNNAVIPMVAYWSPTTMSINVKYYAENFTSTDKTNLSNFTKFADFNETFTAGTSAFFMPVFRGFSANTAVGDAGTPGEYITRVTDRYLILAWYPSTSIRYLDKNLQLITTGGYNNNTISTTCPTGDKTVVFPGTYNDFADARYNLLIGYWPSVDNAKGVQITKCMNFLITQQEAGTVVYIDDSKVAAVSMYYTRNTYSIDFRESAAATSTKTALYQQSLSGYYYEPTRTDATFEGWYTSEDFNESSKVTKEQMDAMTMPYTNMILFAKWSDSMSTVTFDYNDGVTKDTSVSVLNGKTVDAPAEPVRNDYTFAGWKLNGNNFTFDTEIHNDITLMAKWLSNFNLNVKYDADGGVFTEKDTNSYTDDSQAVVLGEATKEGSYFYGWSLLTLSAQSILVEG